jgi:hypothetical protein
MAEQDLELEGLHRDLAERFNALSRLFAEFGSPKGARQLVDTLVSGDAAAFNRLIDPLDFPPSRRSGSASGCGRSSTASS